MSEPERIPVEQILRRHVVYRLYSRRGILLYVGMTGNIGSRLAQHAGTQRWWSMVSTCSQEAYRTREEALRAEIEAIRSENPRHNTTGAPEVRAERFQEALTAWITAHARCRISDGYNHATPYCPNPNDAWPGVRRQRAS